MKQFVAITARAIVLTCVTPLLVLAQSPRASSASISTPRAAVPFEVHEATVAQLQSAMADGRATSLQLVDAYLARIAAFDQRGPAINSMIRLNPQARAEARKLDAERKAGKVRGPMHGVPIIFKDNFNTSDMPTSGGLLALANHQTSDDAFVVKRLRDAGAIILGKSNMHELAAGITSISSLGGQTRNPYDLRRCPGGSSGGTGAAIAASFAAVGWGSDTCGSIRIPSAFGSLVGLRPTQGLVSRVGVMPLSHTQDIAGPLARTVTDLAIALDITVGADPNDPQSKLLEGHTIPKFADALQPGALRGARIGILRNYFLEADAEIIDTVRAAIRAMAAAGADTVGVDIATFDNLLAGTTVINYDHKYDLIDYLKPTPQAAVASMNEILAGGLYQDVLEQRYRLVDSIGTRDSRVYQTALAKQRTTRDAIIAVMDSLRVDVLVYPTMRRRPVLAGDPQLGSTCNLSAQTGLPAISVPAGFMTEGLPVAIELLGRPFADAKLVSLAYAFEQLGARRRAPFSTPALTRGGAPTPMVFATVARGKTALVSAQFKYYPSLSTLNFDTRISGTPTAQIEAVVLRRKDASGLARVVARFSGPESITGSGIVTLTAIDRDALAKGDLMMTFVSSGGVAAEAALKLPR
ncbi:MAG: amidase family protein [Gemmatimonadaceae bacterium]